MAIPQVLLQNNRAWADAIKDTDPEFFSKLSRQQRPRYLWIGCSDSRVPANQIVGLLPGEVFVHRNVGNLVNESDLNLLAVLQFAIATLQVGDIIVCGHHGCGGIVQAFEDGGSEIVDAWLQGVRRHARREAAVLDPLHVADRIDRMCELNVIEQVSRLCGTHVLQRAWARGQSLAVHGAVYDIRDGVLHDLDVTVHSPFEAARVIPNARQHVRRHGLERADR